MGPRAGLEGCGKFRPTGFRSPHIPARSELPYRLSYPGSSQYSRFLSISLLSPILTTLLTEITGPHTKYVRIAGAELMSRVITAING